MNIQTNARGFTTFDNRATIGCVAHEITICSGPWKDMKWRKMNIVVFFFLLFRPYRVLHHIPIEE
jgi:hypothetical protein